jgi:hypothetical protein
METTMKRGDTFIHKRWLDSENKPLECVVTRVAFGVVYWKVVGEKRSRQYFKIEEASKYVR